MSRATTYGAAALLTALALGAMAWSAVPPGQAGLRQAALWTEGKLGDMAGWFRRDSIEGHPDWQEAAHAIPGANVARGAALMRDHGCGSCHEIPGVTGARGSVGPPLGNLGARAYVAGVLPNEPGGLVRWIVNPPLHSPDTAMPDLGVTEDEARDMAAYLYSLGGA